MKNAALGVLLLGGLSIGFAAGSWSSQRERVSAASLRARRILYYVDPMHPAYKSERPGLAPDCGMTLEPIYGDDGSQAAHVGPDEAGHSSAAAELQAGPNGGIHISSQTQQFLGVRVIAVERKAVTERLRLYGRVAADENRVYTVDVGIDGFIRQLSRATTGSHVQKDDWLATFSAPEARSPIQSYLVALDVLDRTRKAGDGATAIDLASAGVQQSIDRLMTIGMSREQIAEVGRTRQVPFAIRIAAPEDGFILARNVTTGQKFERGDELFRIADLRRVWIEADVFGRDVDYVTPGAAAEVFMPGRSEPVAARISSDILPQFDAARQAVTVRLEADNPAYLLRPDMSVDVQLSVTLPPALVVPAEAVLDSGLQQAVFIESSNRRFERREVEIGWRFGSQVEIIRGLQAGDRVVVSGTFLLDSERRLRHTAIATDSPR